MLPFKKNARNNRRHLKFMNCQRIKVDFYFYLYFLKTNKRSAFDTASLPFLL